MKNKKIITSRQEEEESLRCELCVCVCVQNRTEQFCLHLF